MFNFTNKVVLVTAASKGIGFAIAKEFCKAGADVHICSRNSINLNSAQQQLDSHGKIKANIVDCFNQKDLSNWINSIGDHHGHIDILVNNFSGFGLTNDAVGFTRAFTGDLLAIVTASNSSISYMPSGSSIINISSIASKFAHNSPPYAAVKAAINQYTLSQAKMFADKGIRVNSISPGVIEFPNGYWDKIKTDEPDRYNKLLDIISLKRTGRPEEIANLAMFLSSSYASYITGQTICIDGGYKI